MERGEISSELKEKIFKLIIIIITQNHLTSSFFIFNKSRPTYQVVKKMRWVRARGWCVRRGSLLLDYLTAKFNDLKLKNEIDMKHSYFSNDLFANNFFCC